MSKSFFYQSPSNMYRYWLKANRLVIQMKAKDMEKFRASKVGQQVERHADIFQIGGGWYEVTGKAGAFALMNDALREVVEPKAGHKVWLAALNADHLGGVNANPSPFFIERVRPGGIVPAPMPVYQPASPHKLAALASRFGR